MHECAKLVNVSGDIEMPFGSHGMLQGELHHRFPGQMRSMRPGMGVGLPQPGMRPPHMMTPGHYAVPHRQMPPYSEVARPEVKCSFIQLQLQHVQTSAARVVLPILSQPASPLLSELHWLPVTSRITFKITCLAYCVGCMVQW